MAKICFFAKVADPAVLDRVEFYAQDLRILRELGHEVVVATNPAQLVRADLYFCWWWTWAFLPLSLASLLRRPAVVTGVFDEWMFDARPWLQRVLLRFALRASQANVFISALERRVVPGRFRTVRPSFAPCIVDNAVYTPGSAPRARYVLTVAWLHAENAERKGIPLVVRAAALVRRRHPDVHFLVVGDKGSGYPALQALADGLGVTHGVEFRGVVSRDEKVELMQRCAVYLQPSRFEGFGLAVLEAMACGAPVVASTGGALPEVVGGAGVLLDHPTPESIADAVCAILEDEAAAQRRSEAARARAVGEFSYERRRDALRAVIDHALAEGR